MARSCFSLGLQFSLPIAFFFIVIFQTHSEKVETRGRGAAVCPRLSALTIHSHGQILDHFFLYSAVWLHFIPVFDYLEQVLTLFSHL